MSSFISLKGSGVTYELPNGNSLFRDLSFSFGQQTYGLVGPNGIGKTTFLRLLRGDLQPTHGTLSIRGNIYVLPQILHQSDLRSDLRTIEEILGIQKIVQALNEVKAGDASLADIELIGENWNLEDRIQQIFHTFGIGYLRMKTPISQLSGGELVKVYLASTQLSDSDILLLDEPTNNLDSVGRQAVYDFIHSQNQIKTHCIIIASHDRSLLSRVEITAELSNQGLQYYGGNFDFYMSEKEREALSLEQKLSTAQQEQMSRIMDLQRSVERQQKRMVQGKRKTAEGGMPKIMAGRLKRNSQSTLARVKGRQENRLQLAQSKVKTLQSKIKEQNRIQIDIPETLVHAKKEILEIRDFNYKYADSPEFLFAHPINFHWVGPKRVRVSGPNGAGKSTLIRLLVQSTTGIEVEPLGEFRGVLKLKSNRVAHLDQNVQILGGETASLLEGFSKRTPHLSESERRIRLGRFLFNQETTSKKISVLSGGEKMRAALAFALFSEVPPELLILDEPTNNLDRDSIEKMESALSNFQGAILVISHDPEFLTRIGASEELVIPHRSQANF